MRSWVQVLETASCRNAGKGCVQKTQVVGPFPWRPDPAQAGATCTGSALLSNRLVVAKTHQTLKPNQTYILSFQFSCSFLQHKWWRKLGWCHFDMKAKAHLLPSVVWWWQQMAPISCSPLIHSSLVLPLEEMQVVPWIFTDAVNTKIDSHIPEGFSLLLFFCITLPPSRLCAA